MAVKFNRLVCAEMLSPKGSQRAGKKQQDAGKKQFCWLLTNVNALGEFKDRSHLTVIF